MTLPRYPEYRASGVEWLEELPAHWRAGRLRSVASVRYGLGQPPPEHLEGLPLIRATNIKRGKISREGMVFVNPAEVPKTRRAFLSEGEIIVVRSGAYTGDSAQISAEWVGSVAGYDMVATVTRSLPRFVSWQFLSPHVYIDQWGTASSRAAQPHLNAHELNLTLLALPPLPEQHAIVAYLDRETARIDDLIDKKRRLLALLTERRTAIITHAVTKGLPTEESRAAGLPVDPPMKDSGVEWIGEVPDHWRVPSLGQVGTFEKGRGGSKDDDAEDGVPCVRYGDLYTGIDMFIFDPRRRIPVEIAPTYASLRPGDVVFTASGETVEDIGKSAVNLGASDIRCGGDLAILRSPQGFDSKYLGYATNSEPIRSKKASMSRGSTIKHIYASQLRSVRVPMPPLPEQHAIVAYLDRETARIDELTAKVEEAIELLGEYRTALITAAVTGQVDVRGPVEA